jgi:transcriptional regulator with XRE-family HTH domain
MRTFAERLRATREEKDPKMSQMALAELSGISQSTIANIESGRNQGSKHILALARALDVRAQWLEDETGPKTDSEGRATDAPLAGGAIDETPSGLKKIIAAYKTAGPAKQEALLRLAQLPEPEMAPLLLVIQSIGAKYKR